MFKQCIEFFGKPSVIFFVCSKFPYILNFSFFWVLLNWTIVLLLDSFIEYFKKGSCLV